MRILLLALLPLPVHAEDLWCMPVAECLRGDCNPTTNTESSLRLHDPYGPAPMMRSHAEDIAMALVIDWGDHRKWQGTDSEGDPEIVALRPSDMAFTHLSGEWTASGTCEVQ